MKCSIRNSQRSNNRLTDSPRLWWTHLNSWRCWVTLTFLCCLDLLFDLFFNRKVRSSIFFLFVFFCHLCKRSQCFSLTWTEDQNSYYFQSPHFVHLPEETFLCSSAVNTQYSNLSLQMYTEGDDFHFYWNCDIFFFPVCFFCARLLILVTQNAAFTSSCKKTATPSSAKTEWRRCFAGWVKAQQVHQSAW